jgi:ATP phosphoribosyltransferase
LIYKNSPDYVKLALPKGNLQEPVSILMREAGLGIDGYSKDSRLYHLKSHLFPNLSAKIFQEKDIPIQVAIGNYDIGICGSDWVEELLAKYPQSQLIKLTDLGFMPHHLSLASSKNSGIRETADLYKLWNSIRIASEYPNLCEQTAVNMRLRKFKIFPVWGAAEYYPPENADLVLIKTACEDNLNFLGLVQLRQILTSNAFVIVNKEGLQSKNLQPVLSRLNKALPKLKKYWSPHKVKLQKGANSRDINQAEDDIRLALPDGHQCSPTYTYFIQCGLHFNGYSASSLKRRPVAEVDWLKLKVIRPQDMPMQVANNNFDLAITGQDWFLDHMCRFPSSPIVKILDLNFGVVKIVAVVSDQLPVKDTGELKSLVDKGNLTPLRVASEYTNIADYYLRNNHIKNYQIIPTWGATEALIPEDADLLIENTETGKTLAAHKLKIIHTLFHSSACMIANKNGLKNKEKKARIAKLLDQLKKGCEI